MGMTHVIDPCPGWRGHTSKNYLSQKLSGQTYMYLQHPKAVYGIRFPISSMIFFV